MTEVQQGEPVDDEVARLLWASVDDLVGVLGGRWRRVGFDGQRDEEWFVTGEPAQLALGAVGPGRSTVVLARPGVRWLGHQPEWTFDDRQTIGPGELQHAPDRLREVADEIAARRRRSFRWCSTCRELTAPEHYMRHDGVCMGCAAAYHHTVF